MPTSDWETLILEDLDLNGVDGIVCEQLEWKPAAKLLEWIKSADTDGARLLRRPKHDNAEMTLKLRIEDQESMDGALDLVQAVVDKLQRAERLSAGGRSRGLEMAVAPVNSERSGTVYVLTGEVTEIPRDWQDSGWFVNSPTITIRLDCHPFIYSDEIVYPGSPSTDSTPLHTLVVPDVGGDVNAEARLIFTDMAGKIRNYVAWGEENAGYDPAADLLIDSASMVTTGFAGSTVGSVIRATLSTTPLAVCSTGVLPNVGIYRLILGCRRDDPGIVDSSSVRFRIASRNGSGPWSYSGWFTLPATTTCEIDLGLVTARADLQVQPEAKCDNNTNRFSVDYLILLPAADVGCGKARYTPAFTTPTTLSSRDPFEQSAGALTGKTIPAGPSPWGGAGDADDFALETVGDTARRTAVSDASLAAGRFALAGATSYTATAAQIDLKATAFPAASGSFYMGALARYVDANNWVAAVLTRHAITFPLPYVRIVKCIAGTISAIASKPIAEPSASTPYTIRLVVDAAGNCELYYFAVGATPTLTASGQDSDLATSGTLASGRTGIYDAWPSATASTRDYDNWLAFIPQAEAVCFANQPIEFRSYGDDAAVRQDAAGVYPGTPPEYRGGRFWLPPGTSRVAAFGRRTNIDSTASVGNSDGGQLQVAYRERRLVLPG